MHCFTETLLFHEYQSYSNIFQLILSHFISFFKQILYISKSNGHLNKVVVLLFYKNWLIAATATPIENIINMTTWILFMFAKWVYLYPRNVDHNNIL